MPTLRKLLIALVLLAGVAASHVAHVAQPAAAHADETWCDGDFC